ncbi:MAG TPA: GNAT family N-acetyltransferase [Frankiaceae bacterium]|nr:GNAT family N-acetyltransferase [Frankiaceae bacterium]
MTVVATTRRLVLRRFAAGDAAAFAAINADPLVTRYVGGPLSRDASDALLGRFLAEQPYARWAVERDGVLLGFCGLGRHPVAGGDVEIGWRLASAVWGQGLATEAATAVRDLALGTYGLRRLVAVIHPDNGASVRVAEKIGLAYERDAALPDGTRVVVLATRA